MSYVLFAQRIAVAVAVMTAATSMKAEGPDYSHRHFLKQSLAGQRLDGANFEGSTFAETAFHGAILTGANFRSASFDQELFMDAKMAKSDFRGAKLFWTAFQTCNLTGANFEGVDLLHAPMYNSNLQKANLRNLKDIGTVKNCDLTDADLRGANLTHMVDMATPSIFQRAKYDSKTLWPDNFDPATHGAVLTKDAPPANPVIENSTPAPPAAQPMPAQGGATTGGNDAAGLLQAGKFAEAEAAYRRALQNSPKNTEVLGGLAQALLGQNKAAEAAQIFRQIAAIHEEQANRLINGGGVTPPSPPAANPATPAVANTPLPAETAPAETSMADGKPQGIYFMSRYWSYTHTLEKATWYFSPTGAVYENLTGGFSPQELAAHKGPHGTFQVVGDDLEVTWSDGKKSKSHLGKTSSGFDWDAGIFAPVKPIASAAAIAGVYKGGESFTHGGNSVAVSKNLTLNADGTFQWEGIGVVSSAERPETGAGEARQTRDVDYAASENGSRGTWEVSKYSITLHVDGGPTVRMIAFPYDDAETALHPSQLFMGGMMYIKVK